MRKIVYSMMVSLDGFVEGPDGTFGWAAPDEELHRFANEQVRAAGAFLYGRRLYELMAAYWPTGDQDPATPEVAAEFARIWRDKPKVVFSRTLDTVAWNSRLVRDDVLGEVRKLKEQPGGDLLVGGPGLAATLVRHGLVDEYQLLVRPAIVGGGKPFFPALDEVIDLRLVETRTVGAGTAYLRYVRAD